MSKRGKQLHIRLDEDLYKRLKVNCVYKDTSIQEYVAGLISENLGEYSTNKLPNGNNAAGKRSSKRSKVEE